MTGTADSLDACGECQLDLLSPTAPDDVNGAAFRLGLTSIKACFTMDWREGPILSTALKDQVQRRERHIF